MRYGAGYSALGWILNLGMLGVEGTIALTKVYIWMLLIAFIFCVGICCAFWHLPSTQFYTLYAVVGALWKFADFKLDLAIARKKGDMFSYVTALCLLTVIATRAQPASLRMLASQRDHRLAGIDLWQECLVLWPA